MQYNFIKMNGSGNDFVIFDGRAEKIALTMEKIRAIAARDNPVTGGCDQVIVLEKPSPSGRGQGEGLSPMNLPHPGPLPEGEGVTPDIFMRIYNADGSQVNACGNATRCVASILEDELERLPVNIQTNAGIVQGVNKAFTPEEEEYILVDMGAPKFDWKEIPLAMPVVEAAAKIKKITPMAQPSFVGMGNPHVIFFLRFTPDEHATHDDSSLFELPFETIGPQLEGFKDVFPEGVNVSIALLRAASDGEGYIINARVWERGAGLTQACGTAACAMLVAANERDKNISNAHVWFEPFGTFVTVKLDDNGHVLLGGPIEVEMKGVVEL